MWILCDETQLLYLQSWLFSYNCMTQRVSFIPLISLQHAKNHVLFIIKECHIHVLEWTHWYESVICRSFFCHCQTSCYGKCINRIKNSPKYCPYTIPRVHFPAGAVLSVPFLACIYLFSSFISHQSVMSTCRTPEFIWSAIILYMTKLVILQSGLCITHNRGAPWSQITAQVRAWNSVPRRFSSQPIVPIYCPPNFQPVVRSEVPASCRSQRFILHSLDSLHPSQMAIDHSCTADTHFRECDCIQSQGKSGESLCHSFHLASSWFSVHIPQWGLALHPSSRSSISSILS